MNTWLLPLLVALPAGSFAGLLADRLPRGEGVLMGRSRCRACGTTLALRDLVPVLSWLALRGRCRHCAAPIDPALPAIELAALAVASSAVMLLPPALVWPACLLGWTLLALALADARHMTLPDVLTLPLCLAGLATAFAVGPVQPRDALIGAGLGYAILAGLIILYLRLRGRDGMGWGDAKLLAAGGAWAGWQGLPAIVTIAAVGTLAAALLARRGQVARDQAVPFGPGLACGIWVIVLASWSR